MERQRAGDSIGLTIQLNSDTELRSIGLGDADEMFAAIDRNRERLHQWLPWASSGYSIADTYLFLSNSLEELARHESLTMTIRHRGNLCGAIGLHRIDHKNRSSAIGYWIDEAHEGKGIVTAACRAMVNEGFRNFGLHRIEIRCATWNHRSSAVPRRLEFLEEGILREAEWLHDKWVDLRVFSMLAQDWV